MSASLQKQTPWTAARQASLSSLFPRVCSNSCPLSLWCHPAISSSVTLFSCPQSFSVFSSDHVQMWELDHKEGWALKNWCFQTVLLKKTLESLLNSKEINPVNLKGNQHWILIGSTDAKAEAPILWPPDVKSLLFAKDPAAGKNWGQEEKGVTEDEMVGWHHRLNGHEFEQTPRDSEGQGSLACWIPWGCKESDTT